MAVSDIIPAGEYVDWTIGTNVGVRGGIPSRTTVYTTISAPSSSAAINAALAACPAGQVVLLGPGTFDISAAALQVPSNVTLRGSGIGITILQSSGSGIMIHFNGAGSPSSAGSITAGYTKGSTSVTFSGGPTLSVGDFVGIYQDNESWVFNPDGTPNAIYTMNRVEAVAGSTATIWPAVLYGSTGFNPKIVKLSGTFISSASAEELTLLPGEDISYVVGMAGAYNCWLKNLEIQDIPNVGVYIYQSLACELARVDVLGSVSVGDGYGVVLENQTKGNTAIAVYNCVFDGLFHGIISSGQQGCVFAYNYSLNEHAQNGFPYQTAGFNATHGAEGMMSLWEGNYGNHIWTDSIHGGAAYQTVWRNRFTGNDNISNLSKFAMIRLHEGSYWWHSVGNVLGDVLNGPNWPSGGTSFYKYDWNAAEWDAAAAGNNGGINLLGYVGYGQPFDAMVGSTFLRYTNYDYWHASYQDTGPYTIDNSLCFAAKPSWWPAEAPFPAIGPDVPLSHAGNPAYWRVNGYPKKLARLGRHLKLKVQAPIW